MSAAAKDRNMSKKAGRQFSRACVCLVVQLQHPITSSLLSKSVSQRYVHLLEDCDGFG